jgi:hypothetical protein
MLLIINQLIHIKLSLLKAGLAFAKMATDPSVYETTLCRIQMVIFSSTCDGHFGLIMERCMPGHHLAYMMCRVCCGSVHYGQTTNNNVPDPERPRRSLAKDSHVEVWCIASTEPLR